jgi:hypothetical protein
MPPNWAPDNYPGDHVLTDGRPAANGAPHADARCKCGSGWAAGLCPRCNRPAPGGDKPTAFSFERLTGRQLFEATYTQEYLIEDVLVAGQPSIIGALKKSLKTTLMIEQGICLAAGLPFLGQFRVPKPARVGIMSGESGAATIQDTFRRIAKSKNWEPEEHDNLRFCFRIPRLGDPQHLDAVRRFICEDGLQVLSIDPTYLAIPVAENAGNLFAVGSLLGGLSELGQETGCTTQLVHHLRKGIASQCEPPELEDLAWSAFAEWARQWLLIGRREKYDPESDGEHKLWLNIGGSAGHSSLWALDAWEGRRSDPGGRRWGTVIKTASLAREEAKESAQQGVADRATVKKQATFALNREKVLRAFRRFPDGETKTELREAAGLNGENFGEVLTLLLEEGTVCKTRITKGKRSYEAFALRKNGLFADGEPDNRTTGQDQSD